MSVTIAVPYRDIGCRFRRAAWATVRAHLDKFGSVIEVDDGGELFSRAGSLNLAFDTTDADVIIACDADLLIDVDALLAAADMATLPGLVQPFDRLHYLDRKGKVQYRWRADDVTPLLGGCNVLSRETWERVGGWNAEFRGWGCEDLDMARRCETVAPLRRLRATATHLYHPKGGRYAAAESANGALLRRINAR